MTFFPHEARARAAYRMTTPIRLRRGTTTEAVSATAIETSALTLPRPIGPFVQSSARVSGGACGSGNAGPSFRTLPTRLSTGHKRGTSCGAGRSGAATAPSASPGHIGQSARSMTTGIRGWMPESCRFASALVSSFDSTGGFGPRFRIEVTTTLPVSRGRFS